MTFKRGVGVEKEGVLSVIFERGVGEEKEGVLAVTFERGVGEVLPGMETIITREVRGYCNLSASHREN